MVGIRTASRTGEGGRLDIAAWTEAALDTLATHGIDGVRVEVLAKRLAVTKGSFYWHFRDREALLEEMLSAWRRRATLALIERLDRGDETAEARLRRLLRLPLLGRRSARAAEVELAVRLWGRRDPRAADALAEVDALRLRYIGGLLARIGVAEGEVESRAVLAYSYMRVASTLLPEEAGAVMRTCEDIIVAAGAEAAPEALRHRADGGI